MIQVTNQMSSFKSFSEARQKEETEEYIVFVFVSIPVFGSSSPVTTFIAYLNLKRTP
jgi:hypothetical protein